jgi:hypothetical protein
MTNAAVGLERYSIAAVATCDRAAPAVPAPVLGDDLCPIKIADLLFLSQVMTKTSGTLKLVATMVAGQLPPLETAMRTTVMDNQWALRDLDMANAFTLNL